MGRFDTKPPLAVRETSAGSNQFSSTGKRTRREPRPLRARQKSFSQPLSQYCGEFHEHFAALAERELYDHAGLAAEDLPISGNEPMLSLITSASELTFSSRTLLSGFGCDCLRGLLAPGLRAARLAAGFLHPLLRFLWHRRGGGNIRIWIFQIETAAEGA